MATLAASFPVEAVYNIEALDGTGVMQVCEQKGIGAVQHDFARYQQMALP